MKTLDALKHIETYSLNSDDYTTFKPYFEDGPQEGNDYLCGMFGKGTIRGTIKNDTDYIAFHDKDDAPETITPDIIFTLEEYEEEVYIYELN